MERGEGGREGEGGEKAEKQQQITKERKGYYCSAVHQSLLGKHSEELFLSLEIIFQEMEAKEHKY